MFFRCEKKAREAVEISGDLGYNDLIVLFSREDMPVGQVLAVISGKGGTGKTSLTAGVAACLAIEGQRVLCVDCDVGLRNLDISLGLSSEAVIPFTSVMDGECSLDDATVHPDVSRLFLLTAPILREVEEIDPAAFGVLLEHARERFDWTLLDAPAGVGAGFRLVIGHADRAVVVSGADPGSMRDAARAADLAELSGLRRMELVVNRVQPKVYRWMHTTVDDVMDGVGLPLLGIVPEDPDVILAAAGNKPLALYTTRGASAACLHIARRLRGLKAPLLRV